MAESMELIKVDVQNAVQIFTGGGLDAILSDVETRVRALKLDASTQAGRDEIRTVAYQVTRTKTALDAEGKSLTEGWRKNTALVNAERKRATERLETLAEEVRAPLTAFENKERLRVEAHEAAMKDVSSMRDAIPIENDIAVLERWLSDLVAMHPGRDWEEFAARYSTLHTETLAALTSKIETRKKHEADQSELARLRAAETERLQRERDEKLRADAAEKARLETERKAKEERDAEARRVIEAAKVESKRVADEAARVKAESDRVLQEARDREAREQQAKEAAEKRAREAEEARLAAEKKAEAERVAAEAKAAADLKAAREKADRDAELAVQRERERIEAERKTEDAARQKREANKKLRAKIRAEIASDILSILSVDPHDYSENVTDALLAGKVRHVKVAF